MTSPFVEDFLAQQPREMIAPNLAVAINEAVERWFAVHANGIMDQERILGALAAVMTHLILQYPDTAQQSETTDKILAMVLTKVKREGMRRKLGGIQAVIVKQ